MIKIQLTSCVDSSILADYLYYFQTYIFHVLYTFDIYKNSRIKSFNNLN